MLLRQSEGGRNGAPRRDAAGVTDSRKAHGVGYEAMEFSIGFIGAYYRLPIGRGIWCNLYQQFCEPVVSNASQAFMEPSIVGFRTGVDNTLRDDGNRRLACLAETRVQRHSGCPMALYLSTGAQCRMVASVFRPEKSVGRLDRYRPLMGCNSGDADIILEDISSRGLAFCAVLVVGKFCHNAQFHNMEDESVNLHMVPQL